jgi:ATP-dependent RNA helicase DeaD
LRWLRQGQGKRQLLVFQSFQKIDANNRNTQALILSPTRELCLQITNEIKNYSKYEKGINVVAVYGGASITEQARDIKRGAQIIVATPGRMQDMINRGLVNITQINYCILDEADEMLNMGFYEDIVNILSTTPEEKKHLVILGNNASRSSPNCKTIYAQPLRNNCWS